MLFCRTAIKEARQIKLYFYIGSRIKPKSGIVFLFSRLNKSEEYTHFIKSKVDSLENMSVRCNTHSLCHGLAGIGDVILEVDRTNNIKASKNRIMNNSVPLKKLTAKYLLKVTTFRRESIVSADGNDKCHC